MYGGVELPIQLHQTVYGISLTPDHLLYDGDYQLLHNIICICSLTDCTLTYILALYLQKHTHAHCITNY